MAETAIHAIRYRYEQPGCDMELESERGYNFLLGTIYRCVRHLVIAASGCYGDIHCGYHEVWSSHGNLEPPGWSCRDHHASRDNGAQWYSLVLCGECSD